MRGGRLRLRLILPRVICSWYRDLVVRIAGYSAYFVDLSPAQQAEIIARTEEELN